MGSPSSDRPLLTAAVTAFNAADTIERAVESALAQTWAPLEVLIVDDASTDETPAILSRLADTHPQIRVVLHERNQGTAAARNTLIDHARGEALAFFDDDDVSHPARIAGQWERLTSYEKRYGRRQPILCYAGRTERYPDGSVSQRPGHGSVEDEPAPHGDALVAALLWGRSLPRRQRGALGTGCQLGRLSTYWDAGGFDPRFRRLEDSELEIRLARTGGHLIGVEEALVTISLTPSADRTVEAERVATYLLLEKHRDAFPSDAVLIAALRLAEAKLRLLLGETGPAARLAGRAFLVQPAYTLRRMTKYALDTRQFLERRRGARSTFEMEAGRR